ncbi:response regulator [Cypionkella sp.]|uniref:response regulator n=1 Tax=Cypionkella sp. TaxID=2811411 RepID=UPI002AC8D034|nr:response regulator [Cypionkella sp.]
MNVLRLLLPRDTDAAAQIDNQLRVLSGVEPARLVSMCVGFVLMAIFLPPWLALAAMVADLTFERLGVQLMRKLDPARQPLRYLAVLVSIVLMELSYALPCVLIWQQDGEFAKATAVALLSMTLFQLSTVRAIHLPFGMIGTLTVAATAFIGNGHYWVQSQAWPGFFASTLALIAATAYTVETMRSNHLLHLEVSRRGIKADAANRAKGLFLAQMSHELRTPLNAIVGMGEAESTQTIDPEARERMRILVGSALDLATILDDILQMAAVEEYQLPIRPQIAPPKEVIEAVVALFQPVFAKSGLWLRLEFVALPQSNDAPALHLPDQAEFDPQRLRQCLSNLLSNALKFTETGGATVRVSYRPRNLRKPDENPFGQLQIDVSDTGKGIPAPERDLIFQPFQRGAGANAGAGLGLAISRGIAQQMQGDLQLLPSTTGALFRLSLPIRPASLAELGTEAPFDLCGRRILVVDDIATNRLVAATYLRGMSAVVEEAPSGAAALRKITAHRPDLVLLDLHMPGLSGVETLAAIRALPGPHLPVVAMTADVSAANRALYLSAGLDGFLTKPLTMAALRLGLARHLAKPATAH